MPIIRPSSELRNNYSEISKLCYDKKEPVFLTKNGRSDLVVLSMELFEEVEYEIEVASGMLQGEDDLRHGRVRPFNEVAEELKKEMHDAVLQRINSNKSSKRPPKD